MKADDELENSLVPMIDGLSGALAAVILVTIFLVVSTAMAARSELGKVGGAALKKAILQNNPLGIGTSNLNILKRNILFDSMINLTDEQFKLIIEDINQNNHERINITVTSSMSEPKVVYNVFRFVKEAEIDFSRVDLKIINGLDENINNYKSKLEWGY